MRSERGQHVRLPLTAGEADGHARAAAHHEDLLGIAHEALDLVQWLLLADDHGSGLPGLAGLGWWALQATTRGSPPCVRVSAWSTNDSSRPCRGAQPARAQGPDLRVHLGHRVGPGLAHARGHVEHAHALGLETDLRDQLTHAPDALPGIEVASLVVAVALEATRDHDAVGAALERAQQQQHVDLAGAGQLHHAHRRRALHAQGSRQVSGGVGAEVAAEGHDAQVHVGVLPGRPGLGLDGVHHKTTVSKRASILAMTWPSR